MADTSINKSDANTFSFTIDGAVRVEAVDRNGDGILNAEEDGVFLLKPADAYQPATLRTPIDSKIWDNASVSDIRGIVRRKYIFDKNIPPLLMGVIATAALVSIIGTMVFLSNLSLNSTFLVNPAGEEFI